MLKSLIQSVLRGLTPQSAPSPEPPAVKPAAGTKIDWVTRTHELNDFIHNNIDLSPKDKHSLLLRTIESLKEERRSYIQNTNLDAAARHHADAELVKLSLTTVREVRKLQEAYPELKAIKATPPVTSLTTKLSGHLGQAFALAATALSPYATAASNTIKNWSTDTIRDLRQEAKEIKESLVSDLEDTLSSILPSRPDIALPSWANKRNAQIAATTGSAVMAFAFVAGVALHKDVPKPDTPETKPIIFTGAQFAAQSAEWIPAEKVAPKPAKKPTANIISKKPGAAAKWREPIESEPSAPLPPSNTSDEPADTPVETTPQKTKVHHKAARGHNYEHWNWDALFSSHYKDKVVKAANNLLEMHPKEVFQGAILTESGGNQFSKDGQTLRSSANAYGAAQVLVPTAQAVARGCTGASLDHKRFMTDASYNKKIGQCYFEEQHDTFGNNIAALLAYNSGPGDDKGRSGLKRNIRRSGLSVHNDGGIMVDLISSIDNKENRHYVLKTMVRLGLLDANDIGDDVTRGHIGRDKGARPAFEQSAKATYTPSPHYNDSSSPSLSSGRSLTAGTAFNAGAHLIISGGDSNEHVHVLTGSTKDEKAYEAIIAANTNTNGELTAEPK